MDIYAEDIMRLMDEWAPPYLAEKWDHPGLQIGNPKSKIERLLVSLDVTRENVTYAVNHGIHMIISHHPFLFKSIHTINLCEARGQIVHDVIKNDITLFAAHTNLDTAEDGVNDALADALALQDISGLVPVYTEPLCKMVIYVSAMGAKVVQKRLQETLKEEVRSFYVLEDEDNPCKKVRLECTMPANVLSTARQIIFAVEETAACDIETLRNCGKKESMGRVGCLPKAMRGNEAVQYIKERLHMPTIRCAGNTDKIVNKVAVLGGSGVEFADFAKKAGADLYLTADAKYHEAQAISEDLLLVDGGHFYTERVIVPRLAKRLRAEFEKRGWPIKVEEDTVAVDIFHYF